MKHLFYPPAAAFLALLALNSCSDEAANPQQADLTASTAEVMPEIFAVPGTIVTAYEPPPAGEWAQRYCQTLHVGTKHGHRFAAERLSEMGPQASATLAQEIRSYLASPASMGYLVSLCEAFTQCSEPQHADALMELVEVSQTPVVRTAALEAIGRCGVAHLVPRLLKVLENEVESSPRGAGLIALAKIGTQECVDFLEQQVLLWLDPNNGKRVGMEGWNALLLVDNPAVVEVLKRLELRLAPFQALQAYGLRIRFGDRDLAATIKPYLNAEDYPSAGTRTLALQLLGELGDWDAVLSIQDTPELKMQQSLVGLLRREDAVAAGVGEAVLDYFAESGQDGDLKINALQGLIERGQTQRLDPYLRQLREFPTGKGSVQALKVLSNPDLLDPRTDPILISRWEFAEGSYRIDLLRGLTRSGTGVGARFLADRAMDPSEDLELRETAMVILANFGEQSVPLFLEIYQANPSVWTAAKIIPGLGRYADVPAAREQLLYFASSPEVDDRIRHQLIGMLPRIFRSEASDILLAIRADESRSEIVKYIDSVLKEYF
jgi:HEAT repeat protein